MAGFSRTTAVCIGLSQFLLAAVVDWYQRNGYWSEKLAIYELPTVKWTDEYAIAAQRQPLVLTNSPAAQWLAIERWQRDSYLSGKITMLDDLVMHGDSSSVFRTWSMEAPLAVAFREPAALTRQSMSTTVGLSLLRSGMLVHSSRPVSSVKGFPIADTPHEFLRLDQSETGKSATWWVGGNGVSTAAHYDPSHTFYVQLVGETSFTISPPSAYRRLHLYPWLHPLRRHAQRAQSPAAAVTSEEKASDPHIAASEALIATLKPGDVLYIPPLWFYSATAGKGVSHGLYVSSRSAEGSLLGEGGGIMREGDAALADARALLPAALLHADTASERRRALLAASFGILIQAVLEGNAEGNAEARKPTAVPTSEQREWISAELLRRYERGMPEPTQRLCGELYPGACEAIRTPPTPVEAQQLVEHATAVTAAFDAALPASAEAGVREIQLLNMLESLAATFVGLPSAADGVEGEAGDEAVAGVCPLMHFLRCWNVQGPIR